MALAAPPIEEMFSGLSRTEQVDRFEAFKSALAACHRDGLAKAASGATGFVAGVGMTKSHAPAPADAIESLRSEMTTKAMGPGVAAEVQSALDTLAQVNKDWTNTTPLGGSIPGTYGMVPFDLDPALALLIPRNFTLRNAISRIAGQGEAKEFRRITGVSNSGTGGIGLQSPFFSSGNASAAFGGGVVNLQRPAKISYAADRKVISYVELGLSDEVNAGAQYQAQGYQDLRQLSHTALLWAHMMAEERALLGARGNAGNGNVGFVGNLTTPVVTDFTKATASTGGTLTGTLYFKITYSSSAGETVATAEGSQAVTGSTATVTLTAPAALPASVVAWNVYSGTSTGVYTAKTTVVGNSVTITAAGSGSYTVPGSEASASANSYDGLLATYTDTTQSGYVKRLNANLSTSEPGAEWQDAFASLYSSVIADPSEVLVTGAIRRALSKAIQQSGTSTGYRLSYEAGVDGIALGSVVTGLANETTGSMVNVTAHPYMPAGASIIWTKQLPFPDSGVSETTQVASVQDMMVIDWPQIQLSWDASTYAIQTMIHRAPAWSGAITGITG